MKTSGQITLLNQTKFYPGEEGEVEIKFLHRKYLGEDFNIGKKFTFGEGITPLGDGYIISIEHD